MSVLQLCGIYTFTALWLEVSMSPNDRSSGHVKSRSLNGLLNTSNMHHLNNTTNELEVIQDLVISGLTSYVQNYSVLFVPVDANPAPEINVSINNVNYLNFSYRSLIFNYNLKRANFVLLYDIYI